MIFTSFALVSCGEFVGYKDNDVDIGNIQKLELFLSDGDLHKLYSTLTLDTTAPCSVIYNDWHGYGTLNIRGQSSRIQPKKSFTLKVDEKKYVLERGENDGGLYNRIAMRAYQLAGLSSCNTSSVALFLNEEYLGCYNFIDYYKEDILGGELYKMHIENYDNIGESYLLSHKSEKEFPKDDNLSSLNNLLALVVSLSDTDWCQYVLDNMDIESIASYLAVHDFLTVKDTSSVNFYIHFDGKYRILPWDNEQCLQEKRSKYKLCNDNELIRRLASVPEVKNAYNQKMHSFFLGSCGGSYILDTLKDEAGIMFDSLSTAMEKDPEFGTSKQNFMKIKSYVLNYLDKDTGRATEVEALTLH